MSLNDYSDLFDETSWDEDFDLFDWNLGREGEEFAQELKINGTFSNTASSSSRSLDLESNTKQENTDDNFKRKRQRNMPLPRIIRNDIRRHYPTMFVNVVNSNDSTMFKSFLDTFSVENVQITKMFQSLSKLNLGITGDPLPNALGVFIKGRDNIVSDMVSKQRLLTDMVVRLVDSKIVRRPYETACRIMCGVELNVTIIHDVSKLLLGLQSCLGDHPTNSDSSCGVMGGDGSLSEEDRNRFTKWVQTQRMLPPHSDEMQLQLLQKPLSIAWRGCFSIAVDEHKRIESLTLIQSSEEKIGSCHR